MALESLVGPVVNCTKHAKYNSQELLGLRKCYCNFGVSQTIYFMMKYRCFTKVLII